MSHNSQGKEQYKEILRKQKSLEDTQAGSKLWVEKDWAGNTLVFLPKDSDSYEVCLAPWIAVFSLCLFNLSSALNKTKITQLFLKQKKAQQLNPKYPKY